MKRPAFLRTPRVIERSLRILPLTVRGLLFLFCGLALVFLVLGGFSLFSLHKSAERTTEWTLHAASGAAARLAHRLQHERDGVDQLAHWPGIASAIESLQSGDASVAPPWVTLYYLSSDRHDFGDCVFVTDRRGIVMWTKPAGLGLLNTDLSGYPEIRAALEQQGPLTSNLVFGGFWPEPHLLVTTPMHNEQNEVIGLVANVIGANTLRSGELFSEITRLSDETLPLEVYAVDGNGFIVTGTNPDRVFTRAGDGILSRIARPGAAPSQLEGDTVATASPMPSVGWNIVVEAAASELYKDIRLLERNLLGVGVFLVLFALLTWIPFVDSFVGPIGALTKEAQLIAAGDFSHPISSEGRDEITALASALDTMRLQLDDDRGRLQAQVAKLGETNRLKNEFIANLSHEFRTPVHIARGYLDLIQEGQFGEVPRDFEEPLTAISRQYDSLWELLESCLDLARIDEGKTRVSIERFDLVALAREVMGEFATQLHSKQLRGIVNAPNGAVPVTSDRWKIRRILRNFVSNAVKFTHEGEVEIGLKPDPRNTVVTLSVRDTGIGLSADAQELIFERFRQVDGSITRRHDGVGLGLSISSELARLIGGSITVTSSVGVGSTFSVTIPSGQLTPEHTDEVPRGRRPASEPASAGAVQ